LRSKKRKITSSSQSTITSHFTQFSVTTTMDKETFIRGVVQIVMSGVPISFFESPGFITLNGEMARKLKVSLSRESIRRFVMDAANRMSDALIKDLKGKLVYIKMDGATRQLRSFLGVNAQYYDETKGEAVVKTLACADTERKHTSEQMCKMFSDTLQKFEIPAENVLALIVDNASNMTKTVERLNESSELALTEETATPISADDEDSLYNEFATRVHIHHTRCAVHTLQLSIKDGLKQPQCDKLLTKTRRVVAKLRTPNILSLLENEKKTTSA